MVVQFGIVKKKQYPDLSLLSPGFGLISPVSSIRRKLIPIQAGAVDPRRFSSHCPQARVSLCRRSSTWSQNSDSLQVFSTYLALPKFRQRYSAAQTDTHIFAKCHPCVRPPNTNSKSWYVKYMKYVQYFRPHTSSGMLLRDVCSRCRLTNFLPLKNMTVAGH